MRLFVLQRDEDQSGVSGTGTVAEGVEFTDGTCVMRWRAVPHQSTAVYANMADLVFIHGHGGRTRVVYQGGEDSDYECECSPDEPMHCHLTECRGGENLMTGWRG